MRTRVATALLAAVAVLVLAAVAGYAYFALTFGSADYTEYTLSVEKLPEDGVAESLTRDLDDAEAAVVREATASGSAATVGKRLPLDGAYVRWNGTYYRARVEDGGTVEAERYVVGFEPVDAPDGQVREATDLSGEDRRAAELAYRAHRTRQRRDCDAERCPDREYVYEEPPDPGSSAFVPTPEVRHVRVQNVTFRVTAARRTVDVGRTRYEVDRIGTGEAALRKAAVRDLTLGDGSESAQLFERAVEDGSYRVRAGRTSSVPDAFYRVVEACGFDPEDPLYGLGPVSTVVRYEGRYYRVVLDGETTAA